MALTKHFTFKHNHYKYKVSDNVTHFMSTANEILYIYIYHDYASIYYINYIHKSSLCIFISLSYHEVFILITINV